MIVPEGLLMIEPTGAASAEPVVDSLTRKMTVLLRESRKGPACRGFHRCVCGATSDNANHYVLDVLTNSLAVHYLAYHRDEVPAAELDKVRIFTVREAEPTFAELAAPRAR